MLKSVELRTRPSDCMLSMIEKTEKIEELFVSIFEIHLFERKIIYAA